MSRFILRIDDIAPGMDWDRLTVLAQVLHRAGVKPVVGVVPACADDHLRLQPEVPDFWDRIRRMQDAGWSIAQHGYTHVYDSTVSGLLGIGRHSEFAGHDHDVQRQRIAAGKRIMLDEGCWQPIFMAPAHSYDQVTLQVLEQEQFGAVTDGYGFAPYRQGELVFVPQMFSRPYHFGFGTYTICVHTNALEPRLFGRIAEFITTHRSQFITFEEAVGTAQDSPVRARVTRGLTGTLMRTARSLRYPETRTPIAVEATLSG